MENSERKRTRKVMKKDEGEQMKEVATWNKEERRKSVEAEKAIDVTWEVGFLTRVKENSTTRRAHSHSGAANEDANGSTQIHTHS